jgi:hypothetical protein
MSIKNFPSNIIWYPGSGLDLFPVALQQVVGGLFPVTKTSPDWMRCGMLPVLFNDSDPLVAERLIQSEGQPVFRDWHLQLSEDQRYAGAWKSINCTEAVIESVKQHAIRDAAQPLLEIHIRLKLSAGVGLMVRSESAALNPSVTCWFWGGDAFKFFDVLAPALETEISGLVMMRSSCGSRGIRLAGAVPGFEERLLQHIRRTPDRYEAIRMAFLDGTSELVRRSAWKDVQLSSGAGSVEIDAQGTHQTMDETGNKISHGLQNPGEVVDDVGFSNSDNLNTLSADYAGGTEDSASNATGYAFRLREHRSPAGESQEYKESWFPMAVAVQGWGARVGDGIARLYCPGSAFAVSEELRETLGAWWVIPGLIMTGGWPGGSDRKQTRLRAGALLDVGIRSFLNLVPEAEVSASRELREYERNVNALARERRLSVRYHRPGLAADLSHLDDWSAMMLLGWVQKEIGEARAVYVHGSNGCGRSELVLSQWFKILGMASGLDSLRMMEAFRLLAGHPLQPAPGLSPEQLEFVRASRFEFRR